MIISSQFFGDIQFEPTQVVRFEDGLSGFEEEKEFLILNNTDVEEPVAFMWLQSAKNPDLAFVITIPFLLWPEYEVDVPDEVANKLQLKDPSDAAVYSIVKIQDKVDDLRVNLMGPIVINGKNHMGHQVVQYDTKWVADQAYQKK